jgi:hypothetical protein
MSNCLRLVALTAFRKSSLSHALMFRGQRRTLRRKDFPQRWQDRAVRPILEAGGENSWQLEVLSKAGKRKNVVLELCGREILHKVAEAGLVID